MNCTSHGTTGWLWLLAAALLLAAVCKLLLTRAARKAAQARARLAPQAADELAAGQRFHIRMSDGTRFDDVTIVGLIDGKANGAQFFLDTYESALVLKTREEKMIYVKRTAVRWLQHI